MISALRRFPQVLVRLCSLMLLYSSLDSCADQQNGHWRTYDRERPITTQSFPSVGTSYRRNSSTMPIGVAGIYL